MFKGMKKFFVLTGLCVALMANTLMVSAAPAPLPTATTKPATVLGSGTYLGGRDIAPGYYMLFNVGMYNGYYEKTTDLSGDINSVISNELFDYNMIVYVGAGEYLKAEDCTVSPLVEVPAVNYTVGNMYLVGFNIPAGNYVVTCNSEYEAYYEIDSNITAYPDILVNECFYGDRVVTLTDGQFIYIENGYLH